MGKGLNRNDAIRLFHEGGNFEAYEFLGAHLARKTEKGSLFPRVRTECVGRFGCRRF